LNIWTGRSSQGLSPSAPFDGGSNLVRATSVSSSIPDADLAAFDLDAIMTGKKKGSTPHSSPSKKESKPATHTSMTLRSSPQKKPPDEEQKAPEQAADEQKAPDEKIPHSSPSKVPKASVAAASTASDEQQALGAATAEAATTGAAAAAAPEGEAKAADSAAPGPPEDPLTSAMLEVYQAEMDLKRAGALLKAGDKE
jgi:hypothetical protein